MGGCCATPETNEKNEIRLSNQTNSRVMRLNSQFDTESIDEYYKNVEHINPVYGFHNFIDHHQMNKYRELGKKAAKKNKEENDKQIYNNQVDDHNYSYVENK